MRRAAIGRKAIGRFTGGALLTLLLTGTVCAQQLSPPSRPRTGCQAATSAAARLICADANLKAADSLLAKAYGEAKKSDSPDRKNALAREQLAWTRERNQKCGLVGKDTAPLAELRNATQCMADEIKERLAVLQGGNSQTPSMTDGTDAACRAARSAFDRLKCADPELAALDSRLSKMYLDAKNSAPVKNQDALEKEQQTWTRDRNQTCGLTGNDSAPIDQLRAATPCLENSIEARLVVLQADPQTSSITPSIAPQSQNVIIEPAVDAALGPGPQPFQQLRFSATADGISGTIACSAPSLTNGVDPLAESSFKGKWIVEIAMSDSANTYRLFANDTWSPVLDNLRTAARAECAKALASGNLRNTANEPIGELYDVFEVYSPQGYFLAFSTGPNAPWSVQINLPKTRRKLESDLGIQKWIDPSQLTRNPYFFKGTVVGMVMRLDHMLSQNEAIFVRDGAEVFVSGVSRPLFSNDDIRDKEFIVLAGRVTGNKGLIDPSGNEALVPALDYVAASKCGDACQLPGGLTLLQEQRSPSIEVRK
jgi:uncharacterized protein YecT (DUF1311 family)